MNMILKLSAASILALSIAAPVQAQQPNWQQRGDYYAPGQTAPQQVGPSQEQQMRQGDYYPSGQTTPQQLNPGQEQKIQQGDYYRPDTK
jgi:hypothetical protein